MSSQADLLIYKFLQNCSPIFLQHRKPKSLFQSWVFWSESGGCENNSTSDDVIIPIIHDKIKSVFSDIKTSAVIFFSQFWAPVTIGGRRFLSTSAQPFAVSPLCNKLAKYRLNSQKYKYNTEPSHMIKSHGPATAFLNCRISMNKLQGFLSESDDYGGLNYSVMLPICFPSQTNCIGVLEFTFLNTGINLTRYINAIVKEIKKAGLDVFYVQDLIPYNTINGLKLAKDHIEEALKVVGESHKLAIAQVWIPYEDKSHVFSSSPLEDTQTKQLLALKLTGCQYAMNDDEFKRFEPYFRFGDVAPRAIGEEFPMVTLQDYKSCYMPNLSYDITVCYGIGLFNPCSALAICLRSNDTGDYNYVFEFFWIKDSNYAINIHLEALLLTLKMCLPSFKFASGVEIGNELDVHIQGKYIDPKLGDELDIHGEDDKTKKFKIFQGKRSMVVDYLAHSEVTCKTTPKVLPQVVIEKQFGKTMKDATKNLDGFREWPGPNSVKRNKNGSSVVQFNTNEEVNGAIEDTSTVSLNKHMLTIKAEYEDDIIKFHLPVSKATFVHVEKEIGKKLELSEKTYKIKYLDEDGDWITLKSDEEMADCIKSSRKSNRIVVRMRVVSSRQPISGPSGSMAELELVNRGGRK